MLLNFDAKIQTIAGKRLIVLPETESRALPSRGMAFARGTVNGHALEVPLEPDGRGSHWLELPAAVCEQMECADGASVSVALEPLQDWPRPAMPEDILRGIEDADLPEWWDSLTPKAQWEWLRWIRSTKNPATRKKRIDAACSKMESGERRPCCFNAQACTDPEVSKAGVLMANEGTPS